MCVWNADCFVIMHDHLELREEQNVQEDVQVMMFIMVGVEALAYLSVLRCQNLSLLVYLSSSVVKTCLSQGAYLFLRCHSSPCNAAIEMT